jgi:hypothetical protein
MRPEGSFTLAADEAVRRMVTFSENSSTLVLIDRLGEAELQSAPGRLGLDGTVLDPAASFVTTAWDIATLLTALYRGEVVSNDASAAMMELLRAQELNDLIPQSLPPGIEVAHKTGLITEYLNDAGVIYAPGGDFVLVLLTRWDERIGQSYEAIHEFTALVYEAFAEPFERPPPPPPAATPAPSPTPAPAAAPVQQTTPPSPPPPAQTGGPPEPTLAPLGSLVAAAAFVLFVTLLLRRRRGE